LVVEEVEVLVLLVVQARRRFLPEAFAAGGVVECMWPIHPKP